ncbi:trichohyalin-like [Tribolium madens]|uniref:trichohyalin-like n=1 Tax=Tribolium madens TaxID=41895 RepID=UPI001CF7612F|nr:trichohyalin-like [Tribolium madens]
MNPKIFKTLYKLFQEYYFRENVCGDEFIEEKLLASDSHLTDEEIEKFVSLVTHKKFLEAIKNDFVSFHNLRNYNNVRMIMIIFIVLFASDNVSANELFEVFKEIKCAFKHKILQYFFNENNLIQTALTGCKFFEDEYILNQIINPLLNKTDVLKKIEGLLYQEKIKQRTPKPPTVPDQMALMQRKKASPAVPLNTPVESKFFQANVVPKTHYQHDITDKKLLSEFEKNKLKAQKLLAQAKSLDKNYCKPKKRIIVEEAPKSVFKAKKAPTKKINVETRGNVAAVLREASVCIKQQEKDIKNIESLLKGGATLDKYKELEENLRQLEQQKSIEEIERKHLEGLLTFEEAILAKRKLIECNKERFKEFMEERDTFLKQLEDWKEEQQKKIKIIVKKCQEIERNAKDSDRKLKEEKRTQANQFKEEKRQMLQNAYEKQKEELAKKIKLIEEIKALHEMKTLHSANKEFDRTECPKLGLLCEMSIADLQQKLAEMKDKMERQLEQKRKCIQKYKERQRLMIENVKNFITQTRMSKPKQSTVPNRPAKLAQSADLDKLRGQLEEARELRKNSVKLDTRPCPHHLQRYRYTLNI